MSTTSSFITTCSDDTLFIQDCANTFSCLLILILLLLFYYTECNQQQSQILSTQQENRAVYTFCNTFWSYFDLTLDWENVFLPLNPWGRSPKLDRSVLWVRGRGGNVCVVQCWHSGTSNVTWREVNKDPKSKLVALPSSLTPKKEAVTV